MSVTVISAGIDLTDGAEQRHRTPFIINLIDSLCTSYGCLRR
jgi:hypothetical protein